MIELPLKHADIFLRIGAKPSGHGIILAGPPGTGKIVRAPASQIHEVILSLANNAVHAMRVGGGVLAMTLMAVNVDGDQPPLAPPSSPRPPVRRVRPDSAAPSL